MNPLYPAIAKRAGNRCEYCRAPEAVFNFAFDVEHILSRFLGGDDSAENLALACDSCNQFKSNVIAGWDEIEQRDVSLFNPRRDQWNEHFFFNRASGAIEGITAVGRVTVVCLRLNSPFQLRARQYWIRLGLYP